MYHRFWEIIHETISNSPVFMVMHLNGKNTVNEAGLFVVTGWAAVWFQYHGQQHVVTLLCPHPLLSSRIYRQSLNTAHPAGRCYTCRENILRAKSTFEMNSAQWHKAGWSLI